MPRPESLPHPQAAYVLAVAAFWALLWALGFPPPNWDDLFFAGGAIELFEHGRLANPLIRFWSPVAGERYFFQPPFFQYALAGWLHLFDLGSASLRAFQCLAGAVGSAAAGLLLRRHGLSGSWAVPVLWALTLSSQGLRHDALGLALLAGGFLLLDRGSAGVGSFFITSALATWPILFAYAIPLGGMLCFALCRRTEPRRRPTLALSVTAGVSAAFALFLASIGGRLATFLADFSWHAGLRSVPLAEVPAEIHFQVTNGYGEILHLPLYALFLAAVAVAVAGWQRLRRPARVLLAGLGAGMAGNLLLYASTMHVLFDLACWIAVAALVPELPLPRPLRQTMAAAALAVFALSQSYLAVRLLGSDLVPDAVPARAAVPPGRLVGVDEVAARSMFDYRLPPGAFFWNYSVPPPQTWPASTADRPPTTVWVVSTVKSGVTRGLPPAAPVRLFGRTFGSIPARPYDVVVVD